MKCERTEAPTVAMLSALAQTPYGPLFPRTREGIREVLAAEVRYCPAHVALEWEGTTETVARVSLELIYQRGFWEVNQ